MTLTMQVLDGRPVWVDLDAAGNVIKSPQLFPPPPPVDPPAWSQPVLQGFAGVSIVTPAAQFGGPGAVADSQGVPLTDDGLVINYAIGLTGRVYLQPFTTYNVVGTVNYGVGQKIWSPGLAGQNGCVVNFTGTGDCFRQTAPLPPPGAAGGYSGATTVGGGVNGVCVDLAGAASGSVGFHVGDIESLNYDNTMVRHANGTTGGPLAGIGLPGSIGYYFDNHYNFTERLSGELEAQDCTIAYAFDVTDNPGTAPGVTAHQSTGSFARPNLLLKYTAPNAAHWGVVLANGALPYNMTRFTISGNHGSSASGPFGAVLTVTGSVPALHPGAGQGSRMLLGHFDVGVETPPAAVTPQTINFGGAGNVIADTVGILDFASQSGPMQATNLIAAGATFVHTGPIRGDSILAETRYSGQYTQASLITGATITSGAASTVSVNPAGAVTGIIIAPGTRPGQDLVVENLSGNLITFAVAGTSNVAAGTGATVPAFGLRYFKWNVASALWIGGVP